MPKGSWKFHKLTLQFSEFEAVFGFLRLPITQSIKYHHAPKGVVFVVTFMYCL